MSFVGGPDWFRNLFPNGLGSPAGPDLTRLEAAVFAVWHYRGRTSDEMVREVIPVTPAVLARVKDNVRRKYAVYEAAIGRQLWWRLFG